MHTTTALSAVSTAQESLREERMAFSAFAREVADLEPSAGPAAGASDGTAGVVAMRASPPDGALRQVRRCYRETVLEVREDTDARPLTDHMATDFGREAAMAVATGNTFSVPLRKSLLHGARRARVTRTRALSDLEQEEGSLERVRALAGEADGPITTAESSLLGLDFETLLDLYHTLIDLESRADALLKDRQDALRDGEDGRRRDPIAVRTGVYRPLPVSHPILADGASLIRDLRSARQHVSKAIARRD